MVFPVRIASGRIRLVIALVAGAGSIGAAYLAGRQSTSVRYPLHVTPLVHDFGVVRQGTARTVTFHLTNTASRPLRILRVVSGCDCTSAETPQRALDPGESVELPVTWKAGSRRGKVRSDLLILSSVAGEKLVQTPVRLEADVEPDVAYDPPEIVFQRGRAERRILRLSPKAMKTLVVSEAYSTHRAFSAEVLPGTTQVRVAFDPRQWQSDIGTAYVIVQTNSPNEPQCRIPLVVRSPAAAAPPG